MVTKTSIEWTEMTWNPVTGVIVSRLAATIAMRSPWPGGSKAMGSKNYQTDGDPRTSGPGFGVAIHRQTLDQPHRGGAAIGLFLELMSDPFHAKVPIDYVRRCLPSMSRHRSIRSGSHQASASSRSSGWTSLNGLRISGWGSALRTATTWPVSMICARYLQRCASCPASPARSP